MKGHVLALAAVAAIGFSGSAFAEDAAGAKTTEAPTAMTDSELDAVTAAGAEVDGTGPGVDVTLPATAARAADSGAGLPSPSDQNPATRHH